jgi:hypothetical protein
VVEKQPRRQLTIGNKPWQGDFDRMLARRMIRVLVPYSRTLYFTDKGPESEGPDCQVRGNRAWAGLWAAA